MKHHRPNSCGKPALHRIILCLLPLSLLLAACFQSSAAEQPIAGATPPPRIIITPSAHASTPSPTPTKSPTPTPTPVQAQPAPPAPSPLLAQDTFQRTSQRWGHASDGQLWQGDANMFDNFFVGPGTGFISGSGALNAIIGPVVSNVEVDATGSLMQFDANGGTNFGVVLRYQDSGNWYKAYMNGSTLVIARSLAGHVTTLASVPFLVLGGVVCNMRFRAIGQTLYAKAWDIGIPEPPMWLTAQDSALANGQTGVHVVMQQSETHVYSFKAMRL